MFKEAGGFGVTFVELVEHPGGHDGGEFTQDHTYSLADDGKVYYSTPGPDDQHNVFGDEDLDDYVEVTSKEAAVQLLETRLAELVQGVAGTTKVLAALRSGAEFVVELPSENEEGDPVDDEDEEDEEDEEEDD